MARSFFLLAAAGLPAVCAAVQPPAGYYATVDASSAVALRTTLHAVIDGHVEFPYTASSTDTWDILEAAQGDPANPARVIDVYKNASLAKVSERVTGYNREHTWPQSYGVGSCSRGPFTDCHMLFLCDPGYNTARSNYPFGDCTGCAEYPTVTTNGVGGGGPSDSNWLDSNASHAFGSWQVWADRRGDVARALLYMDVRYEGDSGEPDLVLTDNRSLIAGSQNNPCSGTSYMGLLSSLLQWHLADPPDTFERARNDVVFSYQQNRNPFVDHPEWVAIVWGLTTPTQGSVTQFGAGCSTPTIGVPAISVGSVPTIGQVLTVSLFSAPTNALASLELGLTQTAIDLGVLGFTGCSLYVLADVSLTTTVAFPGWARFQFPIPNHANLVGLHLFGQWLVVEPPAGVVATPAVDLLFGS